MNNNPNGHDQAGCSHWQQPSTNEETENQDDDNTAAIPAVEAPPEPPYKFVNGVCVVRYFHVPEYKVGDHYFDHFPPSYWRGGSKWWHERCLNCPRKGHHSKICDQPQTKPRCIYCGNSGHTIHTCTLRLEMRRYRRQQEADAARQLAIENEQAAVNEETEEEGAVGGQPPDSNEAPMDMPEPTPDVKPEIVKSESEPSSESEESIDSDGEDEDDSDDDRSMVIDETEIILNQLDAIDTSDLPEDEGDAAAQQREAAIAALQARLDQFAQELANLKTSK